MVVRFPVSKYSTWTGLNQKFFQDTHWSAAHRRVGSASFLDGITANGTETEDHLTSKQMIAVMN